MKSNATYQAVSESIANFANFIRLQDTEYKNNLELLEHYDACTQDLLHQIELGSSKDRDKAATRLSKVRKNRRVSKDLVDIFEPVHKLIETNEGKYFMRMLNEALGEVRKREKNKKNRIYIPKALTDIPLIQGKKNE